MPAYLPYQLNGLVEMPWWGYLVVTLVLTHITIAAVTIFLHRHQAHRALDLHPVVSHFFRFWLWLTTGMVTREWTAIHRKHHARVETVDDPHSPMVYGIKTVLWQGTELYRAEAKKTETLAKYGHGTPDDWIERKLYDGHSRYGIVLMLIINLVLFGPLGLTIWAVQMLWIPITAAGVINGVGHYWGYRNFEVTDTSTNVLPWGILIGGEELHNNHHTFGSSAKLSSKWWEFDIGWFYIRTMEMLGLAHVKKIPPELSFDYAKSQIDIETVRAVVANRFNLMAQFASDVMHRVHREELAASKRRSDLKSIRRLMLREPSLLDGHSLERLKAALASNPRLHTVYMMREKLQTIWASRATTHEHLMQALQDWCHEAEAAGIHALRDFSLKLRSCAAVSLPA